MTYTVKFEETANINQLSEMIKKAFNLEDTTQESYETAMHAVTYIGESNTIEAYFCEERGEVTLQVSSIGYVNENGDVEYNDITKEFRAGLKTLKDAAPKGWKLTLRK